MKQLIEKAFEESWLNDYYHGNYKGFAQVGFHSGIEWLKSMFPMMYFPPCIMPEDCMDNTGAEGEETIVATTDDYIIFYKHKGFDVAYREYWKGRHNNKWKWKVRYGRYVNDDEILCWMRELF